MKQYSEDSSDPSDEDKVSNKNDQLAKKRVDCQGYVHYPIEDWDEFNTESKKYFIKKYFGNTIKQTNFKKSDFKILYTIHTGKFSKVLLTKWNKKNYVAVKIREKKLIVDNHSVPQIKREIRLLNFIKFPFIMNAYLVQCNVYLYYFMSFACGNSLKHLLRTRILSEYEAKFYCSQIALVLEFLHCIGVVHRGIDAENVLICHDGYVKLTGFSKSKLGLGRRKSLQNLDHIYSIPEMMNQKHGNLYDLWCFGILIYYLCSSENPFKDNYGNINLKSQIRIPEYFSENLKDLTNRLLDYDQCKRLGSKCPSKIRHHPWFDIPWNDLENKRIQPPFLPQCSNIVRHFDIFPTMPLRESSYDPYDVMFRDVFE